MAPFLSLRINRCLVRHEYIATPCAFGPSGDGLSNLREKDEWALADIFFGRGSPDGPWTGPTVGDVALVRSHGGRVLHEFNVPAVRARIIVPRIPDLVKEGLCITVRDVPDATRYEAHSSEARWVPYSESGWPDSCLRFALQSRQAPSVRYWESPGAWRRRGLFMSGETWTTSRYTLASP